MCQCIARDAPVTCIDAARRDASIPVVLAAAAPPFSRIPHVRACTCGLKYAHAFKTVKFPPCSAISGPGSGKTVSRGDF